MILDRIFIAALILAIAFAITGYLFFASAALVFGGFYQLGAQIALHLKNEDYRDL